MLTHATGRVDLEVPRDRDGSFESVIVKKRQRRLGEVDEIVPSLYARGLTTGEISAHFAQIYGASVSKKTISRITDKDINTKIRAFIDGWNDRATPFVWSKTAEQLLAKANRPTTSNPFPRTFFGFPTTTVGMAGRWTPPPTGLAVLWIRNGKMHPNGENLFHSVKAPAPPCRACDLRPFRARGAATERLSE